MQIRRIALPAERRQSESALKIGRAKAERLVPKSPAAHERECALGSLKGRRREPFSESLFMVGELIPMLLRPRSNVFSEVFVLFNNLYLVIFCGVELTGLLDHGP